MARKITKSVDGAATLYEEGGKMLIEKSLFPDDGILYVEGYTDFWVTKDELEQVLEATIIEKSELPSVRVKTDKSFEINTAFFQYIETPEKLRETAALFIAAAKEIERHNAEKKAEEEAEAEAEAARIKAAEAEGKRRREIAELKQVLIHEGQVQVLGAGFVAESLWEAGVRKV